MTDPAEKIAWMDGRIASTETWLEDHGRSSKKPHHIIEAKENDVAKFNELRRAYCRALENRRASA